MDETKASDQPLAEILERLDGIEAILCDLVERLGRPAQRWLGVAAAAEYAGLCAASIRELVARGVLTAHRPMSGRVLIDRHEIDAVFAGATRTPRVRRGTAAADAARQRAARRFSRNGEN